MPRRQPACRLRYGEVLERPNRRAWKARRAQVLVGSNPTLSATPHTSSLVLIFEFREPSTGLRFGFSRRLPRFPARFVQTSAHLAED